ncbi:hypothetical protein BJX66DRAFT_312848 [Aspergillus keveii]|uniref:Uncharacterized protein n=1 Tax=Aspergillus keveii TaxID=714993 RepID=A0ABR4FSX8_9EURO
MHVLLLWKTFGSHFSTCLECFNSFPEQDEALYRDPKQDGSLNRVPKEDGSLPRSCTQSQPNPMSIEELELLQGQLSVKEEKGGWLVFSRTMRCIERENSWDVTRVRFELYMMPKESLKQSTCGERFLEEWEEEEKKVKQQQQQLKLDSMEYKARK